MIYSEEKLFITEIDLNRFSCYRNYHTIPTDGIIEQFVKTEIVSPLMKNVKISPMINVEELRLKVRVSYREVII